MYLASKIKDSEGEWLEQEATFLFPWPTPRHALNSFLSELSSTAKSLFHDEKNAFLQAVLLLICTMAIIHQARGQTGDPAFVRWVDTGEQMGHLDTSIQSYRHPAGREVHLVAAIHVADAAYYRLLNEYFAKISVCFTRWSRMKPIRL